MIKIYRESTNREYEGDFPCITIHYRPQDLERVMEIERYLSAFDKSAAQQVGEKENKKGE